MTVQQISIRIYKPSTAFSCEIAVCEETAGGFSAYATMLPGAASQGETASEVIENMREALSTLIESYLDDGVEIPWSDRYIDGHNPQLKVLRIVVQVKG